MSSGAEICRNITSFSDFQNFGKSVTIQNLWVNINSPQGQTSITRVSMIAVHAAHVVSETEIVINGDSF